MDERKVLKRLKEGGNMYAVSLYAFEPTDERIGDLADEFCEVSHIAHAAGIPEVTIIMQDPGPQWAIQDLDEVHRHTRDMRNDEANDDDVRVAYETEVMKVGYWYKPAKSYAFRISEPNAISPDEYEL